MKKYDVVVIGGGSAGICAAISASEKKQKTLLIELESELGGVLKQCIHSGFGLQYFGEELTGPEYANKLCQKLSKTKVDILCNSFATNVSKNVVEVQTPDGNEKISFKAIVFACGARERTAGEIKLVGERPSGVLTAGQAQKMINHMGELCGKNIVILGSGDIGLIMARRLTLEGAKVVKVLEIMPQSSGLQRNIRQCLEDFSIPIQYNTTVSRVVGYPRITGIYEGQVDKNLQVLPNTEKFVKCDCLLLSVGLIPEVSLLPEKVIENGKVVVNDKFQTKIKSIFVCGNGLHINDLADKASKEGEVAGSYASKYAISSTLLNARAKVALKKAKVATTEEKV